MYKRHHRFLDKLHKISSIKYDQLRQYQVSLEIEIHISALKLFNVVSNKSQYIDTSRSERCTLRSICIAYCSIYRDVKYTINTMTVVSVDSLLVDD